MLVILALSRVRQEGYKFEAILSFTAIPYLKKTRKRKGRKERREGKEARRKGMQGGKERAKGGQANIFLLCLFIFLFVEMRIEPRALLECSTT
jgi:hypothetical protein